MCGIAGALNDTRDSVIQGMLKRINHRGPDDSGFKIFDNASIGNVRLSIIDIAGGHQPMCGPDERQWLVYNGEIYGYKEIREHLQRDGYQFKTATDTEVILALYQRYGLDALSRLNGMFSFCLYDTDNEVVIVARDQFGIKPLVYTILNNCFYFSSEVKAFYAIPEWKPEPDLNAWHAFMNIRFPPSPHTLFKEVKKVPPGCYICLYKNAIPESISTEHTRLETFQAGEWHAGIYRYYSLPQEKSSVGLIEAGEYLKTLLAQSVERQLVADVDVGVYLSGGIDSSTLVALASQVHQNTLNSLCLGFNEPSDENSDAALVAKTFNTRHRDLYIEDTPMDYFKKTVYYMEEPKVNCLQGYLIAREARKYQKVMLSGLGGDELLGGYDIYEIALYLDLMSKPVIKPVTSFSGAILRQLLHLFPTMGFDNIRRGADIVKRLSHPLDMYLLLRNSWDHDAGLRKSIYKHDLVGNTANPVRDCFMHTFPEGGSIAESFMQFELANKMVDDFLSNEDRMSMAHGLEVRVPFLDKQVIEFACTLPLAFKIQFNKRKIVLRKMLQDILPDKIVHKRKHGFTFNPVIQFQKDLGTYASQYLSRERVEESGIFNYTYIKQILNSKPKNSLRWHYFLLWKIVGYHVWEDVFIRGNEFLNSNNF